MAKDRRDRETFVQQDPAFQSEGMMQVPQIEAEVESIQAYHAAKQARIAKEKAQGQFADIGKGLTLDQIWGQGPYGNR